jgi:streptogramin lyase
MGLIYHRQFLITKDSFPWLISNVGSRRADVTKAEPVESVWNQPVDVDFYDQKTYWYKFGNSIRIFYQYGQIADIPLEPQEFPQTVFVDQDGDIWYSTISSAGLNSGLHRYCRTPDYFMHYLTETNAKPTVVYSIAKDKYGNMLAGTQGTSHVTGLDPEGILFQMNTLSKTEVESSRYPRSIFTTVNGIWIGYMNQRLDYLDYHSGEISNIFLSDYFHHREQPYGFRTLYVDSRGNLLVGTIGIYLYTPEKEKSFKKLWKSNPDGLNVYCIKEDSSGTIWAGTSNRLIKLNKDYIIDTVYTVSKNEYNVEDIIFGQKGKIWLALLGGGLELFDTETGQGEFFTTANGLSNNNTYSILKDLQGNLWISTDNGLTRFNTSTHQCRIFGPAEGLKIHEFNADAAFADQHGKMFFGGIGGIVSFYPDSIREENHEEKVYPLLITEFKVSGIPRYFDKALYELSSVTLFHGDDNIEISFACMNFRNADKLRYRYRLKGYKDAWTETDALHRSVIFTGLLPKKYILELEATNMNGDWSVNMQLRITIPPFYYQTVWFKTIMGLLIAVFMGAIVVLYNHQIRLKEKQKQDWLKLESLRGQMNPHFVFNSLNSINYFISRSDKLSANRYIADFSKLIRSMLTNLSRDYIRLTDEIESIEEYLGLEFLRFGDKFTYELKVDKKVNTDIILVFPGLIQPFIENAIWHGVRGLEGRKGHVLIEFRLKEPEHLECLVEDDGIGRCLSEKRKSQLIKRKSRGIDIIRERLKIINNLKKTTYKMTIVDRYADREESGTRVMVDIPSKFPN